jgi:putative oxidoreductase
MTARSPRQQSPVRAALALVLSTRTAPRVADVGLLIVRLVLAFLFIYHGSRRLFGWFNGPGLDRSADYFAHSAHLHPGTFFAVLGGLIEFGGGIALALGLFSRLAGLAIFGDMMMAIITVTHSNGLNATGGQAGWELNLALGVLALVPAFFGSGRFSVDALLERRLVGEPARAVAADATRVPRAEPAPDPV